MTANKHFKHLVRARMAATGETYSEASDHLRKALGTIVLDEPITVDVHGGHGQSVAFTPDGTRLLSAGQDAAPLATGRRLVPRRASKHPAAHRRAGLQHGRGVHAGVGPGPGCGCP